MAFKNELIEISPNAAVNPVYVAMVRRVSGRKGCEVVLAIPMGSVLQSAYSYEYTCKLLSGNETIGDGYQKFKVKNPNVIGNDDV